MDPERVKQQSFWHALPIGWEQLDYAEFLETRRSLIAKVVREGFTRLSDESKAELAADHGRRIDSSGRIPDGRVQVDCSRQLHTQKAAKKMEQVITKTVCGLLASRRRLDRLPRRALGLKPRAPTGAESSSRSTRVRRPRPGECRPTSRRRRASRSPRHIAFAPRLWARDRDTSSITTTTFSLVI